MKNNYWLENFTKIYFAMHFVQGEGILDGVENAG
jgi:hypothetical protein